MRPQNLEIDAMAALFDTGDEYVWSVLERAKVHGEISLAELESIIEAGIEVKYLDGRHSGYD